MLGQLIKDSIKSFKRCTGNMYMKLINKDNFKADTHWVSLGENCLPDGILKRHQRKSYSSVYASARSNIEYALQMEKDDFKHLLSREHLDRHINDSGNIIVRSTYYNKCHNYYNQLHMIGFEFSHHDPLKIKEDYRAFRRRTRRTLKLRKQKSFIFLYHHRINERSNLPFVRERLEEFIALYSSKLALCQIVFFWQDIIPAGSASYIDFIPHKSGILEFICHSSQIWGGDDADTFWAKNDDHLFTEMFRIVDLWNTDRIT